MALQVSLWYTFFGLNTLLEQRHVYINLKSPSYMLITLKFISVLYLLYGLNFNLERLKKKDINTLIILIKGLIFLVSLIVLSDLSNVLMLLTLAFLEYLFVHFLYIKLKFYFSLFLLITFQNPSLFVLTVGAPTIVESVLLIGFESEVIKPMLKIVDNVLDKNPKFTKFAGIAALSYITVKGAIHGYDTFLDVAYLTPTEKSMQHHKEFLFQYEVKQKFQPLTQNDFKDINLHLEKLQQLETYRYNIALKKWSK